MRRVGVPCVVMWIMWNVRKATQKFQVMLSVFYYLFCGAGVEKTPSIRQLQPLHKIYS